MTGRSSSPSTLLGLFPEPDAVDAVFYKLLTANDDSGRHGVLVPADAYWFFPPLPAPGVGPEPNPSTPIETTWLIDDTWQVQASRFVQYDRYPERRITSLLPRLVNVPDILRLLLVAKVRGSATYSCVCLFPRHGQTWDSVVAELAIPDNAVVPGGAAGTVDASVLRAPAVRSAYSELLGMLERVAARGFIRTRRNGDTGVGFTLEAALGIDANTRQTGDYKGIEIKATRSREPWGGVALRMST